MNFLSVIESKREGRRLPPAQIREWVRDFTARKIPDYPLAPRPVKLGPRVVAVIR
jgi:thymidine phosphorylase